MPLEKEELRITMDGCLRCEVKTIPYSLFFKLLTSYLNHCEKVSCKFLVIKLLHLTLPSQNQKVHNAYYTTIGKKRKRNHQG